MPLRYAVGWALVLAACCAPLASAEGVYLTPEEFLAQAFPGAAPTARTLWLSEPLKTVAAEILGHPLAQLRIHYWRSGERTAWIFDEIGKTHPITIGVAVERDAIVLIRVLEFRESRGEEVRLPFFTDQFAGVRLAGGEGHELDRRIDGITGATLSVRAMQRVARLALYCHAQVLPPDRSVSEAK